MILFARASAQLFAGASLAILAACGPAAPPPAEPAPVDAGEALPAEAAAEEAHENHGEDATQSDAHTHGDEDHDHAGGTPHVHGIADLAFVLEGGKLTAEMISPLANFGLSESDGAFTNEVTSSLPGLITVTGGDCTADAPVAEVDTSSGHTDGHVNFSWTCVNPANVSAARFAGFAAFPGFETINAVFIGDTVQKAAELTPSSPELSLK